MGRGSLRAEGCTSDSPGVGYIYLLALPRYTTLLYTPLTRLSPHSTARLRSRIYHIPTPPPHLVTKHIPTPYAPLLNLHATLMTLLVANKWARLRVPPMFST